MKMNQKTKKKIEEDAKVIAELINKTNTDYRGHLFTKIGKNLYKESQYFTANGFIAMGQQHGYDGSD